MCRLSNSRYFSQNCRNIFIVIQIYIILKFWGKKYTLELYCLLRYRNTQIGCKGGSAGEGSFCQARWLEFSLQNLRGRRQQTPMSCSVTYRHHVHAHTHAYMHACTRTLQINKQHLYFKNIVKQYSPIGKYIFFKTADGGLEKWLSGYSPRGSRFNSQHLHCRSQQSVTPVPRDLLTSSGFGGQCDLWKWSVQPSHYENSQSGMVAHTSTST